MRLHSRFQISGLNSHRARRTSWLPSGRGCEGISDGHLPAEKKAGRSFVSRCEDLRDIAPTVQVRDVVIAVSVYSGIDTRALLGRCRVRDLAQWRQLIYLLCYELTYQSLPDIGNALGRDHTTVWHGCKKYRERLAESREWQQAYDTVKQELDDRP